MSWRTNSPAVTQPSRRRLCSEIDSVVCSPCSTTPTPAISVPATTTPGKPATRATAAAMSTPTTVNAPLVPSRSRMSSRRAGPLRTDSSRMPNAVSPASAKPPTIVTKLRIVTYRPVSTTPSSRKSSALDPTPRTTPPK